MAKEYIRKRSAWLIVWNGLSEQELELRTKSRIVAISDSRLSEKSIKKHLRLLYYSDQNLRPSWKLGEMYLQSIERLKDPHCIKVEESNGILRFGNFSPWLEAKRVSDILVVVHNDYHESIYWSERYPGGVLSFKLETNHKNTTVTEQIFRGDEAIPPSP